MMDKEKFLASGLIEQYALGLTSPEETQLVEHFVENDLEIREKLSALQQTVEQYAAKYAIPPPRRLKRKILSEIQADEAMEDRQYQIRQAVLANTSRRLYVGFIGTVLLAVLSIGVLLWRQQALKANNEALSGELKNFQNQYDILQKKQTLTESIFNFIENGNTDVVHLRGTGETKDVHAVVYWNPDDHEAHVKLIKMPAIPAGKQFQIWAQVNGEMVDVGLLDEARQDLQSIKYIARAETLNITIEPIGGNKAPSILLLVANGEI